jgi:hypothetical protein
MKVYTLFKETGNGPRFISEIPALSLFEAKMKARIHFREIGMFLVDNAAFKRINVVGAHSLS